MQLLGWILFGVGSLFLVVTGLIGINGTGNLPGLLIGTACMISGSVFVGSSLIVDAISGKDTHVKMVEASTSEIDTTVGSSSDNDGRLSETSELSEEQVMIRVGVITLVLSVLILGLIMLFTLQ